MTDKNDNETAAMSGVDSSDWLSQLSAARETNKRLNRRVQDLESKIAKGQMYQMGWSAGWNSGRDDAEERARKHYEQKLAEYKHATREEMRKLRANGERRHE